MHVKRSDGRQDNANCPLGCTAGTASSVDIYNEGLDAEVRIFLVVVLIPCRELSCKAGILFGGDPVSISVSLPDAPILCHIPYVERRVE